MIHSTDVEAKNPLLARFPPELLDTLTPEQRAILWNAANSPSWAKHPVNIRLTLPMFGRHMFMTVVAGPERRGGDRVRRERTLHPVRTIANMLFLLGISGAFYLAAVLGIFVFSALIEF